MSSTYAEPFARLEECLDEIGAIDPTYRTVAEKQEALLGLSRVIARAEAERLRVLAAADDVAEHTGDRSTASWLATRTRDAHGTLRRQARLGTALETRWTQVAEAFRAGDLNPAQVRVIDKALTDLPAELGEDLLAKAEDYLVTHAAEHGPRELAILGDRMLHYLAPATADAHAYRRLLAAEDHATAATRLSLRRRGDGATDVHARIPDHAAGRLRTYLAAFTSPRRQPDDPDAGSRDEFARLPQERKQGIGFVALLERVLKSDLPRHGGKATTVAVLIDHPTLVADLTQAGLAYTTTGDQITAGQARRLACGAGLLPAVLGTRSEILDLGHTSRLFKDPQRLALELRDQTCTAADCTIPAAYTDAHHKKPWTEGGKTNLDNGCLLCPFHHHRAHHPHWDTTHHPNGTTTFHRRQ